MFSFGEFKAEDQEKMLQELNRKVEDVYKSCIGDNEAQIRQVNIQDKHRNVSFVTFNSGQITQPEVFRQNHAKFQ